MAPATRVALRHCWAYVPASPSRVSALPPTATTAMRGRAMNAVLLLLTSTAAPSRWRGRAGPPGYPAVRPVGTEVQGVAAAQHVLDAFDLEAHRAIEHEDQLLARMLHVLRPGVRPRLDGGDGPGHEEVAVGAADAGQGEAPLRGEDRLAGVAAGEDARPGPLPVVGDGSRT